MKKLLAFVVFIFPAIALATLLVGSQTVTVTTVAQVVDVSNRHFPMTVSIFPQSGTTGTVEYSTTPNAAAVSSVANWQVLGTASNVSSAQTNTVPSAINALRFTRISGASAVIGEINYPQ